MRWLMSSVALLAVALIATERSAAQDKDKKEDKKPNVPAPMVPDAKDAVKKQLKTGKVLGELIHIEPNKQAFRVKLTYQYSELNQGALNGLLQAQRDAAAARDVNALVNAQRAAAQHRANLYTVKTGHRELTIDAAEKFVVRMPVPKETFDDMGNVKKFTKAELDKLRGTDKLFDGEYSDLAVGQVVQVTLILPKPMPMKPKGKDDLDLTGDDPNKLEATHVAVLKMQPPPK